MRTPAGWLPLTLLLGVHTAAHAYFLDQGRRFDVRARLYSQVAIATEETLEAPPDIDSGDILSHRNFYNPEFDAKLTDFTRPMRELPGLSLLAPDEFNFRFAWWGFYDGIFDYADHKWGDVIRASPRGRQSSSDNNGETYAFNDENKNPRHILGRRNRINELYIDYAKGRFFTRIGRQSISWGEADAIVFQDVINNFDLTMALPGVFMDLEEARIPFWAMRNTIRLVDNWRFVSSFFLDTYVVPGPIDTTVPISTPSFFGLPYSQPGQDPLRNPALRNQFDGVPLHLIVVDRQPKNDWTETRWGARLTSVLLHDYTVQGWFFRTYPTPPVALLLGPPSIFREDIPLTLIDDRGFRTPRCLDDAGNQIRPTSPGGRTPAGRPCKFARPVVTKLYRDLTSVAGIAGTWYSQPLNGIVATEVQYFFDQAAFIPSVNLNPQVQVPGGTKQINTIARADYLRYTIRYDRNFFARMLNPTNSFLFSLAYNGQWNVSASRHKDYRAFGIAKRGKVQSVPGRVPGIDACQRPGANGEFPIICQTAPPTNFEDEREWEQFFNMVLQTDFMHGRLAPRLITLMDVSGIFVFAPSVVYRFTDSLLGSLTYVALAANRKYGPGVFQDRDQLQLRMTYQLN
jgi:hypothetical protein